MLCLATPSCPTLHDPLDCSPSNPGIEPRPPALQVDSLPSEPPGKPKNTGVGSPFLLQGNFPTQESTRLSSLQVDTLPAELPGKPYGLRVTWQKCLWKKALTEMSVANMLTVKVPVTSRDVLGHRNIPSQWFSWESSGSVSLAYYFLILPF